jgi:hypothetical protein
VLTSPLFQSFSCTSCDHSKHRLSSHSSFSNHLAHVDGTSSLALAALTYTCEKAKASSGRQASSASSFALSLSLSRSSSGYFKGRSCSVSQGC